MSTDLDLSAALTQAFVNKKVSSETNAAIKSKFALYYIEPEKKDASGKTGNSSVVKKIQLNVADSKEENEAKILLLMSLFKVNPTTNSDTGAKIVGVQTDDSKAKFKKTFRTGSMEPAAADGPPRKIKVINVSTVTPPPSVGVVGAGAASALTKDPALDPSTSTDPDDLELDDEDFVSDDEFNLHFNSILGVQVMEPESAVQATDKHADKNVKDNQATTSGRRPSVAKRTQDNLAVITHTLGAGVFNLTSDASKTRKANEEEETAQVKHDNILRQSIKHDEQNKENIKVVEKGKEVEKGQKAMDDYTDNLQNGEDPGSKTDTTRL